MLKGVTLDNIFKPYVIKYRIFSNIISHNLIKKVERSKLKKHF